MNARFRPPQCGHNSKSTATGNDIRIRNTTSAIDMTMTHPRANEMVDSPIFLLGSDHSKKKRQRTISEASESCAIEFNGVNSNVYTQAKTQANSIASSTFGNNSSSNNNSTTYSPRMMALLSSLEALDDYEQRQVHPQWTANSSHAPASTHFRISSSTNQAAATLLLQKQRHPKIAQPLNTRPAIHKIEEHPPTPVPRRQMNTNSLPSAVVPRVGSRKVDTPALDTIKGSSGLEQHGITGSTALAAIAATSGGAFSYAPTIASKTNAIQNFPLIPYTFPNNPCTATTTKYGAAHWNHGNRQFSIQEPTSRQLAIHNAAHNDYKKIYKPLQRPPRLPTPYEALVIAVTSTPTPVTSTCR